MKPFAIVLALAVGLSGCAGRKAGDRETSGAHGPASPVGSGQHGPEAYNRPPYGHDEPKMDAEHETAGLDGEMSNGKVDATMEGSGNLGWQGSYEREKRAKMQPQNQAPPASPEGTRAQP
jgi:hypothetical protein